MKFERYESRVQAGEILSECIKWNNLNLYNQIINDPEIFICFAIPNGGVPIAEGFCSRFNTKYDVLIVRKIKIPWNTEAGFGSITTDGTILINKPMLNQLSLSEEQLQNSISITKNEIKERLKLYNKTTNLKDDYKKLIKNKNIFMIDDGLASGFTMLAGINMIKKYKPQNIFIAVPTAPIHTIESLKNKASEIFCPNIRDVWRFAVADAYKHWYDIAESEIIQILSKSQYYLK